MVENNQNLEGNIGISDLSSFSLDGESLDDINEIMGEGNGDNATDTKNISEVNNLNSVPIDQASSSINESVFLDSLDNGTVSRKTGDDRDSLGSYLRLFFFSAMLTILGGVAIAFFYSFNLYITEASKPVPNAEYTSYVRQYKSIYDKVKGYLGSWNGNYESPVIGTGNEIQQINEIINATDLDYIDKKDLLSVYVSSLIHDTEKGVDDVENLKQDIAKQGALPEELEILLSEDKTIDTIQRSLNAIEVIKFSTAIKVFSYMNTALSMISEMMKIGGANVDSLHNLFIKLNSRGEKDISSYVYMCYLNPFEWTSNCDTIGDLDLYYSILNDQSINVRLFKNAMSAIDQLLEKEDTSLFSINFKGFNAAAKSIGFDIEVYTSQEDERVLMEQGIKNPNIFILSNIINLIRQSLFIVGEDINTKDINVDTRNITQGGYTRTVHYSTKSFDVPIQKNTQREIFDYIDLDNMKKLLSEKGFSDIGQDDDVKGINYGNIYEDENLENLFDGEDG